jgi:farnesyl diphosphate synthase
VTLLDKAMSIVARKVDEEMGRLLPALTDLPEGRLIEAMRYTTLVPAKRLRPFLVMASADLFDVPQDHAVRVAAAVELVHAYSLVHDDLPCMDDDDLRRGQPTVHVKFDEATAVLTGDALLTMAFEVLADPATHPSAEVRLDLIRGLSRAAGAAGMVAGQAIDLAAEKHDLDIGAITRLQNLKTGALIAYSCEAGAILGHADPTRRHALRAYAHDIGLAFQITDDLLDIEGSREETGKAVRKDDAANKATLVKLLGLDQARTQARMLAAQAAVHLDPFGPKASLLRDLAEFVVSRRK